MNTSKTMEVIILMLTLLPLLYLGMIYNSIPNEVPMHFNASGEVDRYSSKMELWLLPLLVNILMYALLKYLPAIDPKKHN